MLPRFYQIFTWITCLVLLSITSWALIDTFTGKEFNPDIKENSQQQIIIFNKEEAFDINEIITDTTYNGKIKIVYLWTPSCGSFHRDLDVINKIAGENNGIAPIYIAGECGLVNRDEWKEKTLNYSHNGTHIFLPRRTMEHFFFDELTLNKMPVVIIYSPDNKILYKGHTRIDSIKYYKQIDFKAIIDEGYDNNEHRLDTIKTNIK